MVRKLLNRLASVLGVPAPRGHLPDPVHETADRLIVEGNRAEDAGKAQEACERYREAVQAAPQYAKAHLNLGIGLEATGAADAAIKSYEAALAIEPAEPFASYNLGKLLQTRGMPVEAERLLRQALQSRPEFPEAQVVLAGVLGSQGNLDAAAAALEAALRLRPGDIGALCLYAGVLWKLNRLEDAQGALRRAIAIDPGNVDATYNLATLHIARGEHAEAEQLLRSVLTRDPGFVDAHARLFDICDQRDDLPAAAAEMEAVLERRPDWADALYNYGLVLRKLRRMREAENAFRRAVTADPGHFRAYRMLGGALLGQCRTDEAIELYHIAREQCPDDLDLESAELFALNSSERIADDALFERHAAFGARIEKAHPPRFAPFGNVRDPQRRLRIGYVSGDFCYHVVALFTIPLVERHDRSAVEVYCYSTGGRVDDYTRQLAKHADAWRDVSSQPAEGLAERINRDGIDILVDLGGHTGIPQLAVFAQQPAPVQAAWLGYLNTTGLTRIQYRISDVHADPPGVADRHHTETLVRLPHSQWCYRPFIQVKTEPTPPFARNGYITFGSFNQALKISRPARKLWSEILSRVPNSRLVVLGVEEGRVQADLVADIAGATIERSRIKVLPYVSLQDYYRWYGAVDIALDTLPYSGGTTTCDALWMGVPVVTVPGSRSSSRSTASILTTAGLTDWIAGSTEEYVRRAVEYAGKPQELAGLRTALRGRLRASPLMDEEGFARDLEGAYRQMWRQWCNGGGGGQS